MTVGTTAAKVTTHRGASPSRCSLQLSWHGEAHTPHNCAVRCVCARSGGERVRWALSSTYAAASNFSFARELDKFYTPHDAQLLDDGRLALIDDGSSRPGCDADSGYAGCWSRAAVYTLDAAARTATLDWQFEDPRGPRAWAADDYFEAAGAMNASTYYREEVETRDLFNWDGGSAQRLASERILVAFTSPYDKRVWDEKFSMMAYEVDKNGTVLVSVVVPASSDALEKRGSYRFLPMRTVAGESTAAPLPLGNATARRLLI